MLGAFLDVAMICWFLFFSWIVVISTVVPWQMEAQISQCGHNVLGIGKGSFIAQNCGRNCPGQEAILIIHHTTTEKTARLFVCFSFGHSICKDIHG
jgi:hypothetical protein